MRIAAEHLIPYTENIGIGQPAFFDLEECDEQRLASALAILLYRNAGHGDNIYRENNQVGISTTSGDKEFRIVVIQTKGSA